MRGRTLLYLFIGISAFTALYLYYVKQDRKKSIEKYFAQPKVGDVYKIEADDDEGDKMLRYYEIKSIENGFIVFAPSNWTGASGVDYLMSHYDYDNTVIFSKEDLKAIRDGKWNNAQKSNTTLLEIKRKE